MNQYNITAQVYESSDTTKQTLLINQVIDAYSPEEASDNFKGQNATEFKVIKIYSVEKI
jgi:hypothetical protein